ncbi:AAC(3) family N-acetyltransferase [Paenibacillus antri]|uniref:Aminoglycoside N(3)-acetyltransferase n=1 Tax=Paenibacillus antri TaxID=2582848 RepID=A0A5R9G571_9BACL|nr:AAC(3) family N-acetyltransferase [Paenibacillus antri]TLS49476.1 AAC(3) family N-acetyltransferase [Paenibacillus antri]
MSRERELIERTHQALGRPVTRSSLVEDFRRLGVEEGMTLLVHSAMSTVGWVAGGAQAVIEALQGAVGETGTLVMPTHTGNLSDPSRWQNPPAPESWWEAIRAETPAFDPDVTPVYGMGVIPETFRRMPGVRRSRHPQLSFAAWGSKAEAVLAGHGEDPDRLAEPLGDASPIGRVYELGGYVLLLGVGYENNTSLHLAEYRAKYGPKAVETCQAPVLANGERRWVRYVDLAFDTDDFPRIGAEFELDAGLVRIGRAGMAPARLMPQRPLVDYATSWMERHRGENPAPSA